jgi:hypothetical protein
MSQRDYFLRSVVSIQYSGRILHLEFEGIVVLFWCKSANVTGTRSTGLRTDVGLGGD